MSKSTGNFKTLNQAIKEYSADAMRFALADAGDTMDDANFEHETANMAILRLTKELAFIEEVMESLDTLRDEEPTSFMDRVFDNELNIAAVKAKEAYDGYLFREAVQVGVFQLQLARDAYRYATSDVGMNKRIMLKYIDWSTRIIAPVCPHTAEHVWRNILKNDSFVIKAGWPAAPAADFVLQETSKYVERQIALLRKDIAAAEKPKKVKKGDPQPPAPPPVVGCELVVPKEFGGWQAKALGILSTMYDEHEAAGRPNGKAYPDALMGNVMKVVREDEVFNSLGAKAIKSIIMPFFKSKADLADVGGKVVLDTTLPFDEQAVLTENTSYLLRALGLESLVVTSVSYETQMSDEREIVTAPTTMPGAPAAIFQHKQ
jgi:leucyl-tRNA synthetase